MSLVADAWYLNTSLQYPKYISDDLIVLLEAIDDKHRNDAAWAS